MARKADCIPDAVYVRICFARKQWTVLVHRGARARRFLSSASFVLQVGRLSNPALIVLADRKKKRPTLLAFHRSLSTNPTKNADRFRPLVSASVHIFYSPGLRAVSFSFLRNLRFPDLPCKLLLFRECDYVYAGGLSCIGRSDATHCAHQNTRHCVFISRSRRPLSRCFLIPAYNEPRIA